MKSNNSKDSNQMNLFTRLISFNFTIKHKIIYFLICSLIFGSYFGCSYYKEVKYVINESITTNLHSTYYALKFLNDDFIEYKNKQISNQELKDSFSKCDSQLWMNTECTFNYKFIGRRLKYVDIRKLGYYIGALSSVELSNEELEYHIKNVEEIYGLLSNVDILSENYYDPSTELEDTLKQINRLSKKGRNQLNEDQER